MSTSRWRTAGLLAILLVLLAGLPAAAAGPVLRAADAAAPGGRFIVLWRDRVPSSVNVDGLSRMQPGGMDQRSVVVARPGRAADVAATLRRDPRVITVVPDALVQALDWPADGSPSDALYPLQPDLPQIHVPEAWTRTTGDPSVVVAVIDSGFDLAHPDLEGVAVVAPRNETFNTTDVTDTFGHGTHVAGTIFAQANNEIGIAGIAPHATLMPIKILDGSGSGFFSDLLDGVDWARTHGAQIISMSVGSTLSSDQVAAFQPTFAAARAAGILMVAAAGNSGSITKIYPASLPGVVSVAAVDGTDARAEFSTFNKLVDIAAPGVDLLSTSIEDPSGYERMSGTSMATPHVAGVAALVLSDRPGLGVAELEAVLRSSATDLGAPGRDVDYGDGEVNAAAALDAPVPDPLPNLEPPPPAAGPFTMTFTAPAHAVRQVSRNFSVSFVLSHDAADAILVRLAWAIHNGRCPSAEEQPIDFEILTFRSPQAQVGLAAGACYRWLGMAIDDNDELIQETSPSVWVIDFVRPRIRVPIASTRSARRPGSVSPAALLGARDGRVREDAQGAEPRDRQVDQGRGALRRDDADRHNPAKAPHVREDALRGVRPQRNPGRVAERCPAVPLDVPHPVVRDRGTRGPDRAARHGRGHSVRSALATARRGRRCSIGRATLASRTRASHPARRCARGARIQP